MSHYKNDGTNALAPARPSSRSTKSVASSVLVLEQNDPNPFRAKTTISYQVDAAGRVRLRVYDLLGRHVHTLVDAMLEPDSYTVIFDGSTLAGGTYLYRLETTAGVETRRMTLVK